MYCYKVFIKKISGSLNESVLPKKTLIVKSKSEKSGQEVFEEAAKYINDKYGLVLEMADVKPEIWVALMGRGANEYELKFSKTFRGASMIVSRFWNNGSGAYSINNPDKPLHTEVFNAKRVKDVLIGSYFSLETKKQILAEVEAKLNS